MLIHDSLETQICHTIRVVYNILLRIKQIYREDKDLGPEASKYGDMPAVYCPEPIYQKICSFEELDEIICASSQKVIASKSED